MEMTKKEKIEAMRSRYTDELNDDGIRCEPEVCFSCSELIDDSNKYEEIFKCPYLLGLYRRSVYDFRDWKIPKECSYLF